MLTISPRSKVRELLLSASINIDDKVSADVQINDNRFFKRVFSEGSLGLGESYMEGWWDCQSLDVFLYKLLKSDIETKIKKDVHLLSLLFASKLINRQTINRAAMVAERHYDLGNDLFEGMLDKYMMYSCAYWNTAANLDQAQQDKLDLICRKLHLAPGLRVLDIGCGWGGFAKYSSEVYGVEVTGITISSQQAELARKRCADLPVTIKVQDYREIKGKYDRIVSIGMFEHVGYKNYPFFFEMLHQNLANDGIVLLQTIGSNRSSTVTDPWIDRYIFPNGVIPSVEQVCRSFKEYLVLQDWHNFGYDYDRTLMEWLKRFKEAWPNLKRQYSEMFYRMWEYYLCLSAASFRSGKNNLWQIVFTKPGADRIYRSVR